VPTQANTASAPAIASDGSEVNEPSGGDDLVEQVLQTRLVEPGPTLLQRRDLRDVVVEPDDVVPPAGERGGRDESDVTRRR
jgi:hypothetical protein